MTKPISEVQIGDSVLAFSTATKSALFSEVIATPHGHNSIAADFQRIVTENGSDIKMTAEHLLPSGTCIDRTGATTESDFASLLPLVRAADVRAGDCIHTLRGQEKVVENSVMRGEGIYTIVTADGDYLFVNGVLASPFAVNHFVANAIYGAHRFVFAMAPGLVKSAAFDVVNGVASALAAYFSK